MTDADIRNLALPGGLELMPPRKPAILVVDDREQNLFAMKRQLAKLDADVITAASGTDALALSLRLSFALVLLDVQMPAMNGFEVAQCLRENPETARVPIIFVTAISKEERFVFQGYDSGAVDYIFKPVEPAILLAKTSVFLELARHRSELERLALALGELNERHVRLLEAMHEGVIGFGLEGRIVFANPMAQRLLGAPNRLVGQPLLPFLARPGAVRQEWHQHPLYTACLRQQPLADPDSRMVRSDGTEFPADVSFGPLASDSRPSGGVIAFTDITPRKYAEAALRHQATYDALTNVPNRALFLGSLEQALARAGRTGRPLALLYMDLDGFKTINDRYGHASGDALLKAFCARCRKALRAGDLLARMGGDEFVVLVEDTPPPQGLDALARKLCEESARAFALGGHLLNIGVSIGIAVSHTGHTCENLLSEADSALYAAKRGGKNTWRVGAPAESALQPDA